MATAESEFSPIRTARELGSRLHTLRFEAGWNLEGLAERSGISASSLSRYERGARWPQVDDLLALCGVYGLAPNDLLGYLPSRVWSKRRSKALAA